MTTYGRNFEVAVAPSTNQRMSQFAVDSTVASIPLGAPVVRSGNGVTSLNMDQMRTATNGDTLVPGLSGICLAERVIWDGVTGYDPYHLQQSDLDVATAGMHIQVISGDSVKLRYRNTYNATTAATAVAAGHTAAVASFDANSLYFTPRLMMADAAFAGLAVGNFVRPAAAPSDTAGYWEVVGTLADAWGVVTSVDLARSEFEIELTF